MVGSGSATWRELGGVVSFLKADNQPFRPHPSLQYITTDGHISSRYRRSRSNTVYYRNKMIVYLSLCGATLQD